MGESSLPVRYPVLDFPPWGKLAFTPELQAQSEASIKEDLDLVAVHLSRCEAVFSESNGTYCYTTLTSCDCPFFSKNMLPCKHIFRLARELHIKIHLNHATPYTTNVHTAIQPVTPQSALSLKEKNFPPTKPPGQDELEKKKRRKNILGKSWTAFLLLICIFLLFQKPHNGNRTSSPRAAVTSTTTLNDVRHISPDDVQDPSPRSGNNRSGGGTHDSVTYNTVIDENQYTFIVNTSTKKIHYPDCSSVSKISPSNMAETDDPEGLLKKGYTWCKRCHG
jgi:hypothetical protein